MTERRPSGHDDDRLPEHFLVDGVAPPVIGGGPPESPFDVQPEPDDRYHARDHGPMSAGPQQRRTQPHDRRPESPTSPIPVIHPLPPEQEPKRKSWLAKMFRSPG
jgi:hypothetical protein